MVLYAGSGNAVWNEPRIQICHLVERTAVSHAIDLARVRPQETPELFEPWLRAERFVDVDAKTRALAREMVGADTNLLFQARVIYDYVTTKMSSDAARQSWKGSTEHALVCSVGNCNDIHALFISLCRSVGIPARLILGQALEVPSLDKNRAPFADTIAGWSTSRPGSVGFQSMLLAPASMANITCSAILK